MFSRRAARLLVFLLISLLVTHAPRPAHALTYTVNTLADSGVGSLREAIAAANGTIADDIIDFSVAGTIDLSSALLPLSSVTTAGTLTINGGGTITVNRNSGSNFPIFRVNSNANVTIIGLTISNGRNTSTEGGGIYNNGGTLTIVGTKFNGNVTTLTGGGVYSNGTLAITNSTFSGNIATFGGGGIRIANGTATIINTTFSANATSGGEGGGIRVTNGTVTLTNSTFSGNSATGGGGGVNITTGILNLRNTIVANSTSGGECLWAGGTINAQNSLIEGGTGCVNGTNTANQTADPALGTFTGVYFPLTASSTSAIDTGDSSLVPGGLTTDQAGNARIQGAAVDIGSFETSGSTPLVSIHPASASIVEGTNADYTIDRTGPTTSALSVSLTITPANGDMLVTDYDLVGGSISAQTGPATVTIPIGSSSILLNFAADDDVFAEPDNGLTIALVDVLAYDLGTFNSATATIPANDTVVNTLADSGEGSLRQAIINANSFSVSDTITFTVSGSIGLTSALPTLNNNGTLTIDGGSAITVTRSSGTFRIFDVVAGANVTIANLTITNGDAGGGGGGGIRSFGALTVTNSTISGSVGTLGGGILSDVGGSLTVTGSRILNNNATTLSSGDGVYSTSGGSVTSTCIVGNGDFAVNNAQGTLTATGNWWGTSWGPYIAAPPAPVLSGSSVSSGDSIVGDGTTTSNVNVGLLTYGNYSVPPTGNWLTSAPIGCDTCTAVSGMGSPRVCVTVRP